MSTARILDILRKDLRVGPRSPIFLFAIILPLVMTFVVQIAFTSLLDPAPRLGIVDQGASEVTAQAQELEGVEVSLVGDEGDLKRLVSANDLDAGLVLVRDFDTALRTGERPDLRFYIGGESLSSNRVILSVTTLDLVRAVEGKAAPVKVAVEDFGEEALPLSERLIPVILMYVLIMSGVFLTAFGIVEEREKHTLDALIVTPVRLSEVLAAKALLGFLVAIVMSVVTLALNGALDAPSIGLLLSLGVAALMSAMIGLVFATGARNARMLYALIKGTGFLIVGPVVFYLFPDWPQWIAKVFPTYWFIDPIYRIAVMGTPFAEVWWELVVALGISVLLFAVVIAMTRRMQAQIAGAK